MFNHSLLSRALPLLLYLVSVVCFPKAALGDVQGLVNQINRLPEEQRNRTLLEEARKEGLVYWYTDMQPRNTDDVLKLLNERHPFLKVEIVRLGRERLMNRIMTEYRAGKFIPDVVSLSSAFVKDLRNAGVIAQNTAPFRKVLRQGFMDNEGWINPISTTFYTIFYNTKSVKPEDLPNSYEDLLHPRWRGMIAIDQEDVEWLGALIETMGRQKAIDFSKRLAANKPNIRRGHTLLGQLVAAGESAIFPDQYLHSGIALKKAGAPVDMYFIEPVLTQVSDAAWVTRNAPRPHAALFFTDFLFSKDVQVIFAGLGRLPGRRDVNLLYGLDAKKIRYLPGQSVQENYRELNDLFRQIFTN